MKKIISAIISAAMLMALVVVPLNSYAVERKIVSSSAYYDDIESTASDFNMIEVDEDDVKTVRESLLAHDTIFSISEKITIPNSTYIRDYADSVFEKAVEHTGNPVGGDYIKYQLSSHGYGGEISGTSSNLILDITYNVVYIASTEQEKELENKIDDILDELNVYNGTEYEKIKAVYDYMAKNIDYDFESLELEQQGSKDMTSHSAYAALCKNKAVCQGYAAALYRLLLSLGVDCRIITGKSHGENHAWNIAKIGEKYYLLDVTWDSNRREYGYFLKSETYFSDHSFNNEFKTDEFKTRYPISDVNYEDEKIDPINTHDTPKPKPHDTDSDTDTPNPKPHDSDSDTDSPNPKPHDSDSDTDTPKPKPHDSDSDTDSPNPKPHDSDTDTDTDKPAPTHIRLIGDIDDDGGITAADSLIVLRISVKLDSAGDNAAFADVNEDGSIDSEDALDILRYSVKLSTTSKIIGTPKE